MDVVVDMTDAGTKAAAPTPDRPVYYYPWTAGYVELGEVLRFQKPPPPTWNVLHLIAKALAQKGYLVTRKGHPASIVLVFWWGYVAPSINQPAGAGGAGSVFSGPNGGIFMTGVGQSAGLKPSDGEAKSISGPFATAAAAAGPGFNLPPGALVLEPNDHEMYLFVAGDRFEEDIGRVSHDTDAIHEAAHHPRYFLMVSALDFKAATQKKAVLLWCARVTTELEGRNLDDVLPTLIANGTPFFGSETNGPKFFTTAPVPMGRVNVGTPTLKASYPSGH